MIPTSPSIYLDCHATTPLDPVVYDAMHPWWLEGFGNPHSNEHWFGWNAQQAVEAARLDVAKLVGAEIDEIVFTSGATEANNLAILGAARGYQGPRNQILISAIEHKCVVEASRALIHDGWVVTTIPVDQFGNIIIDELEALVGDKTAIVSVMAVNNEIGTIQCIERIGRICSEAGALFHCDAAQAPAAITIDVNESQIDLLSLSAHKIYGPKGIGALFVRHDLKTHLRPISYGGGQEHGIRSGTLPTPLCVGFGVACNLMAEKKETDFVRISKLRECLWEGIVTNIQCATLNGPVHNRHPGNLNVCFKEVDASALLGSLQPTLAASTGAACTTGIPEPSQVLMAIGLSLQDAESSIRFGIGRFTSEMDIEGAIRLLTESTHRTTLEM